MSAAELVRLSATAGRVFAQVVQVERLAWGLSSENVGQPLVPPEVERKSTAELVAYLTGRVAGVTPGARQYLSWK